MSFYEMKHVCGEKEDPNKWRKIFTVAIIAVSALSLVLIIGLGLIYELRGVPLLIVSLHFHIEINFAPLNFEIDIEKIMFDFIFLCQTKTAAAGSCGKAHRRRR